MNAEKMQKQLILISGLVIACLATQAHAQEVKAATGTLVSSATPTTQAQTVRVASENSFESITLEEAKRGAIKELRVKIETDTTGERFIQLHGTVFKKCLNGLSVHQFKNEDKRIVGFDLRDENHSVRQCMAENKNQVCSNKKSDDGKDDDFKCMPLTSVANTRIALNGLVGSEVVFIHENLAASDADSRFVAEKYGLSFKSIQEQEADALATAVVEEQKKQAQERKEFDRLVKNVKHCRAGNIDVAEEALSNLEGLYAELVNQSGLNLDKYKKEIKVDGLSRMECEVRGKTTKGSCGKFTAIKDRTGLLSEADQLLGSDSSDEEAWVAQNKEVIESDKAVEDRVVELTKAIMNRLINPDENSDSEDDKKDSEDPNALSEEHFDKAVEIAERLEKNVSLSNANKKKVANWKEDMRVLKLSYSLRNGFQGSQAKAARLQSEMNRLMKKAQKACGSNSMFGYNSRSNRDEKAQEVKQQACADAKSRIQTLASLQSSAQMTDYKNAQMQQMQQMRMTQMATAQYYQEQMRFQQELRQMQMGMNGMGISPGMSPVMGSQMYGLGINNNPMMSNPAMYSNSMMPSTPVTSDFSTTGYFNPYGLK